MAATRLTMSLRLGSSALPHVASRCTSGTRLNSALLPPATCQLVARTGLARTIPSLPHEHPAASPTPSRRSVMAQATAEVELRNAPSGEGKIQSGADNDTWQVKILYDGDCPICMKEVDFLQKRNEKFGTLKFVDISTEEYRAEDNAGVTFEQAMGHIHGINRDGSVVTGVEAFRRFYEVIGLGWVYAVTNLKPVSVVADAVYEVWAKYRLPLSGRPNLEALMEERRRAKFGEQGCTANEEEECEVQY